MLHFTVNAVLSSYMPWFDWLSSCFVSQDLIVWHGTQSYCRQGRVAGSKAVHAALTGS